MHKILRKEKLGEDIWSYYLHAPYIAKKRKAGQFIILRVNQEGERIPLTIANSHSTEGWLEIIFKIAGTSTAMLAKLNVGDKVADLVGPLGKPTHLENFGRCICIGGGVGVAPLYPIVNALKESGNNITSIIGARNNSMLILEKEVGAISDRLFVVTDDGSYGQKGFVSDVLKKLLENHEHFDYAMVIGPPIMMKKTSEITINAGIDTYVSLNPIMIDGTGMCGGCRINIDGKTYFACVDGPEFNAKGVDWNTLENRLANYNRKIPPKVKISEHGCKLEQIEKI